MSQINGYSLQEERRLKPLQTGDNLAIFQKYYDTNKKVSIPLEWVGFDIERSDKSQVSILTVSKPIKGLEPIPNDILFKTHNYEIRIVPNDEFFNWTQKNYGYAGELQLYRKKKIENGKIKYFEYVGDQFPHLQYTFEEDFSGNRPTWILKFAWNSDRKINLKGEFCFRLQIYMKHNHNEYRRLFSKFSNGFIIVSKASVILKRATKLNGKTIINLADWKDIYPNDASTDTAPNDQQDSSLMDNSPNISSNLQYDIHFPTNMQTAHGDTNFQSNISNMSHNIPHYIPHQANMNSFQMNQRHQGVTNPEYQQVAQSDPLIHYQHFQSNVQDTYVESNNPIHELHEKEVVSDVMQISATHSVQKKRKRQGLNHAIDDNDSPQDRTFSMLRDMCEQSDRMERENKRLRQEAPSSWEIDSFPSSPMKHVHVNLLGEYEKPNTLDLTSALLTPPPVESSPITDFSLLPPSFGYSQNLLPPNHFIVAEDENTPLGSSIFSRQSQ